MTDQLFELENFRGPLDLLLHLIREQELEITEINLSKICDQYLTAIELMEKVDINVAGEFLVIASTLLLIKSRTILPREEEVDLAEELDPGDELIQQLLEYRKFKTLSIELGRRAGERALRHGSGQSEVPPDEQNELADIELWDLVGTFVRLMEEIGLNRKFDTLTAEKPLRAYLRETLACLGSRSRWSLRELILEAGGGEGLFGYFLSLLELIKTRQINIVEDGSEGQVVVELREDRDESRLSFLFEGESEAPSDADAASDEPSAEDQPAAGPLAEPPPSDGLAPSDEQGIVASPRPPVTDG
jgi:segregation and condensation protein A